MTTDNDYDQYPKYFQQFVIPEYDKYKGFYIALHFEKGIVAHGSSLNEIKKQLHNINRLDVIIDFIPKFT